MSTAGLQPDTKPATFLQEFQARLPYTLDPFQVEAMQALEAGKSVLVAAPTGTGKTVIAEFGIALAHRAGLRSIYTTPIKALSNQKFRDFSQQYSGEVGLLTGDIVVNPGGRVLVMTTEVLRNMLVQGADISDVGVVVFDEVHYMGDPDRGTAWEESILLAPRRLPLVCLSATVPNLAEIAAWLRASHGELECIFHAERAVPLETRYYVDGKAWTVLDAQGRRRRWFAGVGGELASRIRGGAHGEPNDEREPREEPKPWEVLRELESQRLTPAIYFLFGRRACEEAAESCLVLKPVPHGADLVREARARLADLPPQDRALRQLGLLFRLLPRGVAVHHAGLLPVVKILVEEFFASGRLRAVFATDTLALGINMPARTVVLGEMVKFDGETRRLLTPNEYRQMVGRAGRRGIDEKGYAVILYSPWVSFERSMEVATGELLPLVSAFNPDYSTALNLWRTPKDQDQLADLYARSLRRFQHDRRLEEITERWEALQDRFEALKARSPDDPATWRAERELNQAERELRLARKEAAREARATVTGLARVLELFGYVSNGRPTWKADYLRAIFDTNALTLAELVTGRYLEALEPDEIAELCSWFAFSRDVPVRSLPITRRLQWVRQELDALHGAVLAEERLAGVEQSRVLNDDFRGAALAWAQGQPLGAIAGRARIAEGDLVSTLQKTLDVLGQLKDSVRQARRPAGEAAARRPNAQVLLALFDEADRLLRRGVVEASYQWALRGPPEPDAAQTAELGFWPSEQPEEERRPRRPFRRARTPVRRPGRRQP